MGRHAYLFQSDFPSDIKMPPWLLWNEGRLDTGPVNPSGDAATLYRLKCLMLAEAMIMAEARRILESAKRTPTTPETETP